MKKTTLFLSILCFALCSNAQHVFDPISGPVNVSADILLTLDINDATNSAAVPASSTGAYGSFRIDADWVASSGDPWSEEAEILITTNGGDVDLNSPSTGGDSNGNPTSITFQGDFAMPYVPETDGLFQLTLTQSFAGSNANWSNITITIFEITSCSPPSDMTTLNTGVNNADLQWSAGSSETEWSVEWNSNTDFTPGIGTAEDSQIITGNSNLSLSELSPNTQYFVYYRANCTSSDQSLWVGPFSFTTDIQFDFTVDCSSGPININFCYFDDIENNPSLATFTYNSSDGTPLNIIFNSGDLDQGNDELVVLDSDGSELYNDSPATVNGLNFQSSGDSLSWYINSNSFDSCQTENFTPLDVIVACTTCVNPQSSFTVVDDCANSNQFFIDVNITDLGDATSVSISNNINSNTIDNITATGVYQVGPFPFLIDVIVSVNHDQDVNCQVVSSPFQLSSCPPNNDSPCDATLISINPNTFCNITSPGTLVEATPSGIPNGSCLTFGDLDDDIWFQFTALSSEILIELQNLIGEEVFIGHAVYEGSCDALSEVYCANDLTSTSPPLNVGETYYLRVFAVVDFHDITTFDVCIKSTGNNIIIDQNTYTVEQLVQEVLIAADCAEVTNISFSTGSNFGDVNGIGYFTFDGNDTEFPFQEGILISTGDAALANGPNTEDLSSGGLIWPGDADIDATLPIESNNATIIEFDFVSFIDEISFDFLMASEEYDGNIGGDFECEFSDAFAFLLTDQDGNTTNLAVIPGTDTPVVVTNIHPDNPTCPAINEQYFAGYTAPNSPPTSFNGRTTVFTASAAVNVGETYRIKLVIADDDDTLLDTGVFFRAGSFDLGELDLGEDITIASGLAVCLGSSLVLDTQAPTLQHTWFKDGIEISGETSSTIEVTEPGTYTSLVIFSNQCFLEDDIIVEFIDLPSINQPQDFSVCSASDNIEFILTDKDQDILGGQNADDFTITYHNTEQNAIDNIAALISPYTGTNGETIYARLEDNTTGCFATTSFNLVNINLSGVTPPTTIEECDDNDDTVDGLANFDLETLANGLGLDTAFNVTVHPNQTDADANANAIASPFNSASTTVVIRIENASSTDCYETFTLDLNVLDTPEIGTPSDFEVCSATTTAEFNLTDNNEAVLNGLPIANHVVTYHNSLADAEGGTNALSSPYTANDAETIYVRLENTDTACFATTTFDINISNPSLTINNQNIEECDDNDGTLDDNANFNLGDHIEIILNEQNSSNVNVSFHESQTDADNNTNPLPEDVYASSNTSIFVRVENINETDCYATASFNLIVIEELTATINRNVFFYDTEENAFLYCPGSDVETILTLIPNGFNASEVTIQWFLNDVALENANGLSYTVSAGGTYTATVSANSSECIFKINSNVIEINNCIIPQGISPGVSPGFNDSFDLRFFDVTQLDIFNRNGTKVYSKQNYRNEWIGQSDNGDELPVGTYFYYMVYEGGANTKTGWVYLNR